MSTLADILLADDDLSSVVTPTEKTPAIETGNNDDDSSLPAKFRGKSRKEIVDAYSNLESKLGSMANELGTQRQLADQLLGLKRQEDLAKPKAPPITAQELLEDPEGAIERAIAPRVAAAVEPLRQENANQRVLDAKKAFESNHPDYQATVRDPEFAAWVNSSPLRQRAANVANGGDWIIADELFKEYESSKNTDDDQTSTRSVRRAALTSGGSAGGATDSMDRPRGKVYSRAALMKLRLEDPSRFEDEDFSAEIDKAYAEGRVR